MKRLILFLCLIPAVAIAQPPPSPPSTSVPAANSITEAMLKAVDTASDEECFTYEATGGDFEWQSCGAGAGDVTDVGDCASGACLDGSSDGGSYVRIYDGDSHYGEVQVPNIAGNVTYTFPTTTSTLLATDGDGSSLTSIDAATGDSATAFFDAGTIEHERGGLEADVNAYTGLLAISGGATSEVDAKAELEAQIADVANFAEADGDTYSGTHDFTGATVQLPALAANEIGSAEIDTIVESIAWNAAGTNSDGTQCADPAEVTINSGPITYTTICADNDASTIYGHVVMPDSWNAGTVTMTSEYIQTAADTNVLNGDIACMCRGAGETVNNTWGSEIAIDDAAVTGSNAVDQTDSAAMTCNGTCAAGDTLFWRYQLDATGTTTAVATLHFVGWKMEYTSNVGD